MDQNMIEELRRIQNQKFADPWAERDYQIAMLLIRALPKFLALYDAAKNCMSPIPSDIKAGIAIETLANDRFDHLIRAVKNLENESPTT